MATYHIEKHRPVLTPGLAILPREVTETFYQELDELDGFRGHVLISMHAWDEPWPTWEVHPEGDEFVCLIEGDTDFVLHVDGEESVVRVNEPGQYVIVPRGAWHTARPHTPTRMLFVTPGEGTINALEPGGEPV